MNWRFIDWIWQIRGSVPLAPGQSSDEAFDRLAPLFSRSGTSHERTNGTLTFRKRDQEAQDKMSIFDGGVLQVEQGATGPVMRYAMTSRALLFCFLAPLLFLGLAQLTIFLGDYEQAKAEAAEKTKPKKPETKKPVMQLHWIDKALGAPAPEKKDPKKKDKDKKPSPTPSYVFAGIFATLYVVGRILEDWLIKSLFTKTLLGSEAAGPRTVGAFFRRLRGQAGVS